MFLISVIIIAWGVLNPSLNVNNNVTVVAKNLALDIISTGSTCPAYQTSAYSLTNTTIALTWDTISEPGSSSFLFCLENVGTATSATFTQGTVSPSPAPGTLTLSAIGSVAIGATAVTPITETLTASTGTPAASYSFTLTIA